VVVLEEDLRSLGSMERQPMTKRLGGLDEGESEVLKKITIPETSFIKQHTTLKLRNVSF
jgi:predicted thioredoxin/glutaredoxin